MAQPSTKEPDVKGGYAPKEYHAVLDLLKKDRYPPRAFGPVEKREVVLELSAFGKMSEKLLKMMSIPRRMFCTGEGRFTSDPLKPAVSITHLDFLDFTDQSKFPEYSIAIGSRGSNVFCTIIDKKRGILVSTSIKSMYAEGGNWDYFQSLLEAAIKKAGSVAQEQKKSGALTIMIS